jgi:hypothetical protein
MSMMLRRAASSVDTNGVDRDIRARSDSSDQISEAQEKVNNLQIIEQLS